MTAQPIRRVLYISTARRPLEPAECDAILRTSRRNNARVGLTGLLVTGGRRFLQVLEGDPTEVSTVLARIAADPRHFALVTLSDQAVAARGFPQWAMGHSAGAADAGTTADLATLTAAITDPSLRAYFEGFAQTHARAA